MTASDHLNEVQFMPTHEMVKHWDPNLKDPETFRSWTGPGYMANLAEDIRQHGMQHPIQIKRSSEKIYDGHHRLLVAMDLGHKEVPYKWVSGKPGEQ